MRILTRYLVREMIGPFCFGLFSFAGIMFGFELISLTRQPALDGLTVLRLSILGTPQYFSVAFPMGILLGTLFALGRLSSASEVTAMRAAGMTAARIMIPFVIFGLLASFACLYMHEVVSPIANRAASREKARILSGGQNSEVLRQQVLPAEYDQKGRLKRLIHIGEFDLKHLYLRDVNIWELTNGVEKMAIHAESMIWDGSTWRFSKGTIRIFNADGSVAKLNVNGGRADYQPLLPKPREIAQQATDPAEMGWSEFRIFIRERAAAGVDVRRLLVELYTRLSIPFACLALAIIGTPLGVQKQRSGAALSFGLSLAILILYFFVMSFCQVMARAGILPPVLAAWLANILVAGAGIALFLRRMQ